MWNRFKLQPELVNVLEKNLKLESPTRVQEEVLSKINSKCDIFAASQTGTGKTFCFVLPILNKILQNSKANPENEGLGTKIESITQTEEKSPKSKPKTLALVIVPTRELALQISGEFKKFKKICKFRTCCLIGGMSREKQIRILEKGSDVVIATVGRLLDLIQNEENISLKMLGLAKYLVIDEVDRLIELGQFKELKQILAFVDQDYSKKKEGNLAMFNKNKNLEKKEEEEEIGEVGEEEAEDQKSAEKLEHLTDEELIRQIESQMVENGGEEFIEIDGKKISINDEFTVERKNNLTKEQIKEIEYSKRSRKTYLFSATLTQISWTSRMLNNKKLLSSMKAMKNNNKFKNINDTKEFPKIFDIMRKIRTNFKLEIINCTKSEEEVFPENMEILKVKCIAQEKMLHLYHYIEKENCQKNIVFCNSVRSSRQVLNILSYCGFKVLGLHSHMQQRQRIKKVEKFQLSKDKVVLVTTDVASRGLHVDNVGLVVHFHTPRDYDTFVHRSGRTARMGNAGKVVLLEDSHDRKRFAKFQKDVVHKALKNIGTEFIYFFIKIRFDKEIYL